MSFSIPPSCSASWRWGLLVVAADVLVVGFPNWKKDIGAGGGGGGCWEYGGGGEAWRE